MTTMDQWTEAVCAALGLDPVTDPMDTAAVLELAREAAHGVLRPAAPVSTYLLGLAVGRGADPHRAAATLTDLARTWPDRPSGAAP